MKSLSFVIIIVIYVIQDIIQTQTETSFQFLKMSTKTKLTVQHEDH
jgi:hypothetical protein